MKEGRTGELEPLEKTLCSSFNCTLSFPTVTSEAIEQALG